MASTPLLDSWLQSLPERTREIIALAGETVERFDGNVKMAEVLASLSFMRVVDNEANPDPDMTTRDRAELLKVAGQLNKLAADLKQQRLDIMDKFENVTDAPRPAAISYMEVEAGIPEKIRRLAALGMTYEARMLAEQNGLLLEDLVEEVTVQDG